MSENGVVDEVEGFLRERSRELTTPRAGECLACFVARMLRSFGCDTTLRWAKEFRDQRAPKATALERRLEGMGGFCDCEIFLNGISMVDRHLVTDPATGEPERWPEELPSCDGVRAGSTRWRRPGTRAAMVTGACGESSGEAERSLTACHFHIS